MQNVTLNMLQEEQIETLTKKDLVLIKVTIALFSMILTISCIYFFNSTTY
jgi:hypothetical protein